MGSEVKCENEIGKGKGKSSGRGSNKGSGRGRQDEGGEEKEGKCRRKAG
jgi:hypothetical protein